MLFRGRAIEFFGKLFMQGYSTVVQDEKYISENGYNFRDIKFTYLTFYI